MTKTAVYCLYTCHEQGNREGGSVVVMREELDPDAAQEIETQVRALMRRYGVSALYMVDGSETAGFRYWSFGDGCAMLMRPTQQPQTYAVVRERVAQAA